MSFDFDRDYFDFTLPLKYAVATRRFAGTSLEIGKRTPDQAQLVSVVSLSPHVVTHVDILPPDPEFDGPYSPSSSVSSVWLDRVSQFEQRRIWDAVVLDCRRKQEVMLARLADKDESKADHEYLADSITSEQYRKLLDQLAITPDDILAIVDSAEKLRGKLAVVCTGWPRFAPKSGDLYNAFWTAWHPFVLSPYVARDTINALLSWGCAGLCVDTYSIVHPLCRLQDVKVSPHLKSKGVEPLTREVLDIHHSLIGPQARYVPVFECLHVPDTVFHEHTYRVPLANVLAARQRKAIAGTLAVFLLDRSLEHSAVPVRLLFQENRDAPCA